MRNYFFIFSLFLTVSCSPSSPEDFNNDSAHIQKELYLLLKEIEVVDDIVQRGPKIRHLSYELVSLVKKADVYYKKVHEEPMPVHFAISDALKTEMKRIYRIEGGRELIEKYQREALILLDDYAK